MKILKKEGSFQCQPFRFLFRRVLLTVRGEAG